MKKNIDLHTHCYESTGDAGPSKSTVRYIIDHIKSRGLDGIAVTDHDKSDYGFRVKDAVDRYFPGEVIIIPGQETRIQRQHVVELYLADNLVFKFCAHPLFGKSFEEFIDKEGENIHGIEIKNGAWQLNEEKVRNVAEKYNLLMLENSDAHSINEIGAHYNTIDLQKLYDRCNGNGKKRK